jgi:hypothetical protein
MILEEGDPDGEVILSFEIDSTARLVSVQGSGPAQAPEWIGLFDRVLASDRHQPGYNFLIDRREITSIPSKRTVDRMIDYYGSHSEQLGRCRIASVTLSEPAYGMTRMASVFAERTTVEVGVFRDFDEALRWLASP